MNYEELTPAVRKAMLEAYDHDQASPPGRRKPEPFSQADLKTRRRFHRLLRQAIADDDGNSLQLAVDAEPALEGTLNVWRARSEFSHWYTRGLANVLLAEGVSHAEIYLAQETGEADAAEPHDRYAPHEGAVIDLQTMLEHQANRRSPFSMPHSPWCRHLIRRQQPKTWEYDHVPVGLTVEEMESLREFLEQGSEFSLPGETRGQSVYRITFEDGCTYLGRTKSLIVSAAERVCGEPNGIFQWGASMAATQHAQVMDRQTVCLASNLSDRAARETQRFLMHHLPNGLQAQGNTMAVTPHCPVEAENQEELLKSMRRFHTRVRGA